MKSKMKFIFNFLIHCSKYFTLKNIVSVKYRFFSLIFKELPRGPVGSN